MSIWTKVSEYLTPRSRPGGKERKNPGKSVTLTIACICLGAKLAKRDGRVTIDEVRTFREVFPIAKSEEENAARVFNYAKRDVVGYEFYARQLAALFKSEPHILKAVLERLFQIAEADGVFSDAEEGFLKRVNQIFGLPDELFRLRVEHSQAELAYDPYRKLGVSPNLPLAEIRNRWSKLVRDNHPDRFEAGNASEQEKTRSTKRLIEINEAWRMIKERRESGISELNVR